MERFKGVIGFFFLFFLFLNIGFISTKVRFHDCPDLDSKPILGWSTKGKVDYIDNDAIIIKLVSPQNNSINKGGTIIDIDFVDINDTPVVPVTEMYKWDDASNFEAILNPLPMADGLHTLYVEVESEGGPWYTNTFSFYSDNIPPEITLISPENGTHTLSGTNIIHWDTSYPSGSLYQGSLFDVNDDNNPDVVVGGSSRRIYAFDGYVGTVEWQTSEQSAIISEIINLNDTCFLIGLENGAIHILSKTNGGTLDGNTTETSDVLEIINDASTERFFVLHENNLRMFNHTGEFVWEANYTGSDSQDQILTYDIVTNSESEVIVINDSSFVRVYNQTNGTQLYNFSIAASHESSIIDQGFLYSTFSNGYVRKYNLTDGSLEWETDVETGQIIYDLKKYDSKIICSTGGGKIAQLHDNNGSVNYIHVGSTSYIKKVFVQDYDKDSTPEILIYDGIGTVSNIDFSSGLSSWNYSTGKSIQEVAFEDLTNDTFIDATFVATDGSITAVDPRATIPKLVSAWTNVSFSFLDDITGTQTFWEKYSWDGQTNVSEPGTIPASSGIHTLDVYVSDNASNIAHSSYSFFSLINIKVNSPPNGTSQQSGAIIDLTLSEQPLQQLYKWDGGSFVSPPTPLPSSETTHTLYIFLKDQSQNSRSFKLIYTTDNTPISTITLQTPANDSVVEGGDSLTIDYSEIPHIEYYSWNGASNTTSLSDIPVTSDTHILDVFVADEALNWKSARFVFHTKIQITLVSYVNNTVIDPNIQLNYTFGEIPDTCQYKIDSSALVTTGMTTQSILITMPSTSLTHTLMIRVNDSVNGRWNEETYIFITKILVNLTSHTDGGFAETGDSLTLQFSDTPTTKFFSWDGLKNSSRTPVVPSPDGFHYFDVYVGNSEGYFWAYHYTFTVDTDIIDILLITPTNHTRVNSWTNLSIQFSEIPHTVQYRWNNQTPSNNLTGFPTTDGGHTLNTTVADSAGNSNSALFYWIVDNTPINVTSDNTSSVYSGDFVNVSFNNETPIVSWYSWNSQAFSPTLPPTPWGNGTHTLNVSVSDGLNWNVRLFNYTVIDLPPEITIPDYDRPHRGGVSLPVEVNETIVTSWHKWGNLSSVDGLTVVTPSTEGNHVLTVFAEDQGGSFSQKTFPIVIDNTPIALVSVEPKNSSRVKGGEQINLTFDETPFSISYAWNNGARSENLTSLPTTAGSWHMLNIKAFDEAGNLLDVNLRYYIPSADELNAPLLLLGIFLIGAPLATLGVAGYIKREVVSTFLKKHVKLPKRTSR